MPKFVLFSLVFIFTLFITDMAQANEAPSKEKVKEFTFVLANEQGELVNVINQKRAETRFTPWSTFKVANSVIGLDTGNIAKADSLLSYDKSKYVKQKWWPEIWSQDTLTLTKAFEVSGVPFYRQLAVDIGKQQMQQYLTKFDYGNQDISSGLDNFWLDASVQISALEQVTFLRRLFQNEFNLKASTLSEFKKVMQVEKTDDYVLYAKTGAGGLKANQRNAGAIGWYVGVVETAKGQFYFAVNVDGKSFRSVLKPRIAIAREELKKAGLL